MSKEDKIIPLTNKADTKSQEKTIAEEIPSSKNTPYP